ncbi:MAG: AMP-binding protein, partial [Candidatus Nanohaloarchaea archaeon]|nr:AMP-binding protein [Candidatus Nanohaloarchaea archaeon]
REQMEEAGVTPDDIDGIDDIGKLPVTYDDDLLDNQRPVADENKVHNESADIRRPFTTSGSTGNPKKIFRTEEGIDTFYGETAGRMYEHFDVDDDVVLNYYPFVGLNPSCVFAEEGIEAIDGESVPVSNTPYPLDAEQRVLETFEPDDGDYALIGLPSHVDAKGKEMEEAGYEPADLGIETIIMGGEPVGEERKNQVADTFDADVYEHFAATEVGGLGVECTEGGGIHVLDDLYHVEVVDEEGNPVDDGGRGELVVTPLIPEDVEAGTPLLRYSLGDVVELEGEQGCGCDLDYGTTMQQPQRDEWEFILGGVNLDTLYFEDTIFEDDELAEAVTDYQIQIDYEQESGRHSLELLLEADEEYAGQEVQDVPVEEDSMAADIGEALLDGHSHLNDTVNTVNAARIDVKLVEELDVGEGKPERIIDRRQNIDE